MSWHADQLQPAMARSILDVASFWGPALTGTTITMLAPVTVLALQSETLPRWLGVVTGIALLEQLVETITIFGRQGFIAPGGPMNLYLGAGLVAVALLCLGVVTSRIAARSGRCCHRSGSAPSYDQPDGTPDRGAGGRRETGSIASRL